MSTPKKKYSIKRLWDIPAIYYAFLSFFFDQKYFKYLSMVKGSTDNVMGVLCFSFWPYIYYSWIKFH